MPTGFRCAIVDRDELIRLRSLRRVVRLGHVRRVEADRLVLERGEHPFAAGSLVVDCSARGIAGRPAVPVFAAALCAWVEAHRSDIGEQNLLCPPNPVPSTALGWVRTTATTLQAAKAWRGAPDLLAWLETCRLDLTRGAAAHAHEPRLQVAFVRRQAPLKQALQRAHELLA